MTPGPKLLEKMYATRPGRLAAALDELLYSRLVGGDRVSLRAEISLTEKHTGGTRETFTTAKLLEEVRAFLEHKAFEEVTER